MFISHAFRTMSTVALLVFAGFAVRPAEAQIARREPTPNDTLKSTEVSNDHKVTFRIYAPKAEEVSVSGDFGQGGKMSRDDQGVWSITVGPLEPDFYSYTFLVDGVRTVDPKNPRIKQGIANVESMFLVPGEEAAFEETHDVPHGELRAAWYYSRTLGMPRRMHVYTPPGYECGSARYPVLYLLHGGGDEDSGWSSIGRAGFILDNLIAANQAVPMIVVMPNGSLPLPKDMPARPAPGEAPTPEFRAAMEALQSRFTDELLNEIVPTVEKTYRVRTGSANRALAGLSMGGGQTLRVLTAHPDQFAYVAIWSAGLFGGNAQEWEKRNEAFLTAAENVNRSVKRLEIVVGDEDFALPGSKALADVLKKRGVEHELRVTGGGHTWINWRHYLHELAAQLFQPAQASSRAAVDRPGARSVLPTAKPEDAGVSSERLRRVQDVMQRHIDERRIAGAVTLVARRGRVVHFEAQGLMDVEANRPMYKDTIFRMASTTKPVTGVAVMMLAEEGKVRLTDPVSKFIPEFKDLKVAVEQEGKVELVPAERSITIRDLLTHTSGLVSGGAGTRTASPQSLWPAGDDTLASYIERMAQVPLDFQPGSRWGYSGLAGIDALSRVVEIASGQPYDAFLLERVFEPLGMKNTFFYCAEDERPDRFASLYKTDGSELQKMESFLKLPKGYFCGAGGLASTAEDYFRFAQMLANGGELNGKRILSPRSVALMSSNHVGEMFGGQLGRPKGMGFGLTVEVVIDSTRSGMFLSEGSYGWDGAFGTRFWVAPKDQLVTVFLVQSPAGPVIGGIQRDFETAVMQALVD